MNALEIKQLTKRYPNGVEALKGIDLSVGEGDFFALLGPNGAGKTTAIGIITSLVNKTSGSIKIFDHDIDTEHAAGKATLGVVPQELNLNQWDTVFNCVAVAAGFYGIPRSQAVERAEQVLKQLKLWDKRSDVSRNLSGGMKRRLMIARALVHEPRLLILDEPTAGVDIEIRRSMWSFLEEINRQGTTIILTTHYLEEAENLCRNVAIIDRGMIVENDSMSAVIRKLQREVFILNTSQPLPISIDVDQFAVKRVGEYELQVEISRGQDLNDLFSRLSQAGLQVTSMRNKSNRLEELFIRLTERGSEESEISQEPQAPMEGHSWV